MLFHHRTIILGIHLSFAEFHSGYNGQLIPGLIPHHEALEVKVYEAVFPGAGQWDVQNCDKGENRSK